METRFKQIKKQVEVKWMPDQMFEDVLKESDAFVKIGETLSRIGPRYSRRFWRQSGLRRV